MKTAVENDIAKLHVTGTSGVRAHLGIRGASRLVLAAPRTYRVRGELVTLPQVIGVARRPLRSTAVISSGQGAATAA